MHSTTDALIVGAGFAGLAALKKLRDEGFDAIVVERGGDVGGTWYWNRYPGLRCDVESMHYSYSWDDELQQEWRWTERYAAQPEILAYARHVADRFDLRRRIRFGADVTQLEFDEGTDEWLATVGEGDTVRARWVVLATGALSTPKSIDIPGAADFTGETYETTDWPEDPVLFSGKRVAVIGTGSSGIQVATEIAKDVGELFVMQRTPSYSIPARNRPLTDAEVADWKARYSEIREAARHSLDGLSGRMTGQNTFDVEDARRREIFDEVYEVGVPFTFFGIFNDVLFDERANAAVHDYLADRIRERVDDPEVAEKLIPSGYPFGTRRCCIDSGYYEIFNQPNVSLVALRETPIERISSSGIVLRAADGRTEDIALDAIVFATGYDAFTGTLERIRIVGRDGRTLSEEWRDGARTYLGAAVHGFPNLFIVTGPHSPSVLSNMIVSIEQHVDWITGALRTARDEGATRMEADAVAQREWVEHAQELAQITMHRASTSWYSGANVDGKPRLVLPYVGGVGPFRAKCDEVASNGYRGLNRSSVGAVS